MFFDYLVHNEKMPKEAHDAILFDASEIAQALDQMSGPEGGSYPRESYGICAPPYSNRYFWIEATTSLDPVTQLTEADLREFEGMGWSADKMRETLADYADCAIMRGSLCIARDWEDSDAGRFYRKYDGGRALDKLAYSYGKWVIEVQAFTRVIWPGGQDETIHPDATAYCVIGKDGWLMSDPNHTFVSTGSDDPGLAKSLAHAVTNTIPFTLLALSFLHRRTKVDHVHPNRVERKRFTRDVLGEKRGIRPLRDYYIVRVTPHVEGSEPLTDLAQVRPLRDSGDPSKRVHSVRGHFRLVGTEGLFGKGWHADELLWIPDHARGLLRLGKVGKRYVIKK